MDPGNGNEMVVPNDEPEVGSSASEGNAVVEVGRNIRTPPARIYARLRNQALSLEVFHNELLRKKIVGYAIFSGANKKKAACSLRLVGKSWNETVIKLLQKHKEPLFKVSNRDCEERLERFWGTFASSTPINGSIPPFSLQIFCNEEKILTEMYNLLTYCGSGLVQLTVNVNTKGKPCKSQFPIWSLPGLRKMDAIITLDQQFNRVDRDIVTFGQEDRETFGSALINALRDATTNNVEFKMSLVFGSLMTNAGVHRSLLESVTIPDTITDMLLTGELRNGNVEFFVRKPLPNLTSLALRLRDGLLDSVSLFRILDNYRASLKKLAIGDFSLRSGGPTLIRFPVMEKLEDFLLNSGNHELEPGLVSLEKSFPKLNTLRLSVMTAQVWKWTANTKFISVTSLHFCLSSYSNNLPDSDMETMQRIHFAFPNVRNLTLNLAGKPTSGLKYLFQEITQLTELKLSWWDFERYPDFWDSVLTGASIETVAESRVNLGIWDRLDLIEEEALGSIKNLQELTSLTLQGAMFYGSDKVLPQISDVAFKHALLKMPKLRKLYLIGRFVASEEMTQEWRKEGRLLEYKK